MKVFLPYNANDSEIERVLARAGIEVNWVEYLEDEPPPPVEECVQINDRDNFDSNVFDRGQGEFLILERYIRDDYTYGIYKKLTPSEFYSELGMPVAGPCIGSDISDHLVKAFDIGIGEKFGVYHACTFAYRALGGEVIFQHST